MKKFMVSILVVVTLLTFAGAAAAPAGAVSPLTQFAACAPGSFFGFPTWDACLDHDAMTGAPKLSKLDDIWLIAFSIVETLIRAAGYLAAGFIVWGGIKYIRSAGNPSEIAGAKTVILNAIIGLVIAIVSVAGVNFVASRF